MTNISDDDVAQAVSSLSDDNTAEPEESTSDDVNEDTTSAEVGAQGHWGMDSGTDDDKV